MLLDIQIKNFRCFEDTKIEGFQRVNLIGGKNNSGKTALLEAIYFCILPTPKSILFLKKLRNEFLSVESKHSYKYWDNLFFNRDNYQTIQLISHFQIPSNIERLDIDGLVNISSINTPKNYLHDLDIQSLDYSVDSSLGYSSQLIVDSMFGNDFWETKAKNTLRKRYLSEIEITPNQKSSGILYKAGSKYNQKYGKNIDCFLKQIPIFFPSSFAKISNQELARNFDLAILNDQSDQILTILQKLDPTIAEIRSLTINEPDIYLRRKGENFLPISLFGDCFNRVLDIILRIINSKNSVCLIDEIENGIHYQNQREFWRSLFKLAVELDVQIFATTHSLEMIQAFADVGLNSYPNEGAYIELARNEETNQIVGIKRDLELLQYSLKHEEGVGLRGE